METNSFDLVIGLVANDSTPLVIDNYISNIYTKEEEVKILLPQNLTDQFAFLTPKSLTYYIFKNFRGRTTMKKIPLEINRYFSNFVINLIMEKYGFDELDAIKEYYFSETYKMLNDVSLEIYKMSHLVVFDMWENEKNTGNPRNSEYIRSF